MTAAIIAEAIAHAESVTEEDLDPGRGGLGYHFGLRSLDTDLALCGSVAHVTRCDLKNSPEYIRGDVVEAALAHLAERVERAEAALDAAERVAATRLDRINVLRLALGTVGGMSQVLALDDQVDREPARKCGPMVVSVDEGNGLRLSTETPFEYSGGRALRAKTSEANPGGRVRLWRLVLVEDWHRLPGEEDEKGAGRG